jgi:uncharacterized membrane protein YeiH
MDYVIGIIEFLAILTFAYTGLVEARRKEMDFVGACSLALITAFGGGTIRDLLLNRRPLYWIEHYEYTVIIFVLSGIVLWLFQSNRRVFTEKIITPIDALGLGLFSASGVAIALENGVTAFPAALIGVVTAVAGGIVRDVLCAEIPAIFLRKRLYVTCSFVGVWTYIVLIYFGFAPFVCLISCTLAVFFLRMAAVRFDIRLPL